MALDIEVPYSLNKSVLFFIVAVSPHIDWYSCRHWKFQKSGCMVCTICLNCQFIKWKVIL